MNREPQPLEIAVQMHSKAKRQGLDGYERLADYQYTRQICNGIGAEWMPKWTRTLVSKLIPSLVPTSWIHDIDYEIGGDIVDRAAADWRFLCNGFRASIVDYPWYRLKRYISIKQTIQLWLILRFFGQAAFNWHIGKK